MRIQRTCKICGDPFAAIKTTQFFCSRKCFKRDYYLRTKVKQEEEGNLNKKYPQKQCPFCEEYSILDFDPVTRPQDFNHWFCPHCKASNELIWKHQHKYNSHQIISEILITFEATIEYTADYEKPQKQMEIYRLPVTRPELGNRSIVVMACEMLNMMDIRKNNRKKILFS